MGYGDIQGSADELMDEMIDDLGGGSGALGSIASWLGDTVSASVAALGLEPCDLRLRKPVLTGERHSAAARFDRVVPDIS